MVVDSENIEGHLAIFKGTHGGHLEVKHTGCNQACTVN